MSSDRTLKRIRRYIPVEIIYDTKPLELYARITDITATGAFIELENTLERGSIVEIIFTLPMQNGEEVEICTKAIVQRSSTAHYKAESSSPSPKSHKHKKGMGVVFEGLTKKQKIVLYKFNIESSP